MARRNFNWRLATVLLMMILVLGGSVVLLRSYQRASQIKEALRVGTQAFEAGRWEDAAAALGQYVARNRDDTGVLLKYAEAQLKIRPQTGKRVQQALAAYRAVLRVEPTRLEALKPLSELYLATGTPGEAELILRRYLAGRPDAEPELQHRFALALEAVGKTAEAVTTLEGILRGDPNYVPAYESMGQLSERHPDDVNESPLYWFDQGVAANPASAGALLARAAFRLRRAREGVDPESDRLVRQDLKAAEALDPNDVTDHLRLAALWLELREFGRVDGHLNAVAEQDGVNPRLWQLRTQAAVATGAPETMARTAEEGLAALGDEADVFLANAVELFLRAGHLDQAQASLERLEADERFAKLAPFLRGWLLQAQGDFAAAVSRYQRALELGYDTPRLRLLLSESLRRSGDEYGSLVTLQNLVSRYPRSPEGRAALARALVRQRRWEEAHEQAREAALLQPEDPRATILELRCRVMMLSEAGEVPPEALADVERRLDGIPTRPELSDEVRSLRLLVALQKKDVAQAEAVLGPEPDPNSPRHVPWLSAQASLLLARQKDTEAEALLQRGLSLYPGNVVLATALAELYVRRELPDRAVAVLEQAAQSTTEDADQRRLGFELADILDRVGQPERATQGLVALLQAHPRDIQTLRRLLARPDFAAESERAQDAVETIRDIEGADGLQWRYEQARLWARSGDVSQHYEESSQLLDAVLRANPDDQASRMLLGGLQEATGHAQLAAKTFQDALSRDPGNVAIVQAAVRVLRPLDPQKALDALSRALGTRPQDPTLLRAKVAVLEQLGRVSETDSLLETLYGLDATDNAVGAKLASRRVAEARYDDANDLLTRLDPNAVETLGVRAEYCWAQGDTEGALATCDRVVSQREDAASLLFRARFRRRARLVSGAMDDYGRALALDPNNQALRSEKAEFHRQSGDLQGAIREVRALLQRAPDDMRTVLRLADLQIAANVATDAVELLQTQLKQQTTSDLAFTARTLLARALYASGRRADGVQLFEELAEKRPGTVSVLGTYFQTLTQGQEWSKAEEVALRLLGAKSGVATLVTLTAPLLQGEDASAHGFAKTLLRRAVAQHPEDPDVWTALIALAQAARAEQRYEEAEAAYRRVASGAPKALRMVATNNLAWVLSEDLDRPQDAYALTTQAIQDAPAYLDLKDTHGVVCWRLGKLDEADRSLQECVDKYPPENPAATGARFHLARVKQAQGQVAEARRLLREARQRNRVTGGLGNADLAAIEALLGQG